MTQYGMLEDASLQVEFSFPNGSDVAARITVKCRESHIVLMEQDLTAEDLVNLFGHKVVGKTQGQSRLAPESQLRLANKKRSTVSVRVVDVPGWNRKLDVGDGDHLDNWATDVARVLGADNSRVSRQRYGVDVQMLFYRKEWTDADLLWLDLRQAQLTEMADARAARLARRFGA